MAIDPYGFTWSADSGEPVTVERTATLPGGRSVTTLKTPRRSIEVYASRTGLLRVFLHVRGKPPVELK